MGAAQQDFNTLTALGQSGPNKNGQTFQQAGRAQDFQAIGQALENGDLAGAQSVFATLEGTFGQQSQQSQSAISAYSSNSGVAEIVINLGSPSGTSASSGSSAPEVVVNVGLGSASPSGASGISEVVINLGGASETSSTSSASNTSASSGTPTPEIVVNLGQESGSPSASPEEVTINLGSGSSGIVVDHNATQGQNGPAEQLTINLNPQSNYELILNLLNSSAASSTQSSSNALGVSA